MIGLTEMIGVDRVLFGSDWPHPEGNITPVDYVECIQKLDLCRRQEDHAGQRSGADQPLINC